MKKEQAKTPAFLLEQLALGEISAADERVLRSVMAPAEIDAALAELRAADARFHARRG